MEILVTGGAGFIGSNFILHLLDADPAISIVNVDKLTYAGNLDNLKDIDALERYRFIRADISDGPRMMEVFEDLRPEAVVNFAAESHVDRSIEDAEPFIRTNVLGTQVLLDCARTFKTARFLHISTDEVYGQLGESDPAFTEETHLAPNSPYAASKAAADHLVLACHHTHGQEVVLTRCSNNYGPFQFPEKLIPLMIRNALNDEPLPVYGDGSNIRDWIYVQDHCLALRKVLSEGVPGRVYNIGGKEEMRNLDVVLEILRILEKPESLVRFVADRPGHDFRYAMDISRLNGELGWQPTVTFSEGLERTIHWYLENPQWIQKVISGEYMQYYDRMYGDRIS